MGLNKLWHWFLRTKLWCRLYVFYYKHFKSIDMYSTATCAHADKINLKSMRKAIKKLEKQKYVAPSIIFWPKDRLEALSGINDTIVSPDKWCAHIHGTKIIGVDPAMGSMGSRTAFIYYDQKTDRFGA